MTTMATPTENLAQQVATTAPAKNSSVSILPLRLRNFFAKYPPQNYSAAVAPASRLVTPADAVSNSNNPTTNTSEEIDLSSLSPEDLPTPYTPNRDVKGNKRNPTAWSASKAILFNNPEYPNPFLPQPSPNGKKWRSPKYGLRQQADLIKLAKKYGVEQLLPTSRKSTTFKETRLAERGLAIKGTGIGHKVKGHKWERTMETRLEERKKAMMEMPELIRQWKQVSSPLSILCIEVFTGDSNLIFHNREVTDEDGRSGPDDRVDISDGVLLNLLFASYLANSLKKKKRELCVLTRFFFILYYILYNWKIQLLSLISGRRHNRIPNHNHFF